jgi:hypothetical protein
VAAAEMMWELQSLQLPHTIKVESFELTARLQLWDECGQNLIVQGGMLAIKSIKGMSMEVKAHFHRAIEAPYVV